MPTFASAPAAFTDSGQVNVSFGPIPAGPYVSGNWECAGDREVGAIGSKPLTILTSRDCTSYMNPANFGAIPALPFDITIPLTASQLADINSLAPDSALCAQVDIATAGGSMHITELLLTLLPCGEQINPTSASFGPAGGAGVVTVTANGSFCPWSAVSNTAWIHLTGVTTGPGSATVPYSVDQNSGQSPRSGTITLAAQTFTVNQSACGFSISPTSAHYPSSGGGGTVAVATGSGCAWSALSNNGWIQVVSGSSGIGAGSCSYSVAPSPNPSSPRQGSLSIAGQLFTVTEDGIPASVVTFQVRSDPGEAGVHQFIHVTYPFGYVQGVRPDMLCGSLLGEPAAPLFCRASAAGGYLAVVDSGGALRLLDPAMGMEIASGAPAGPVDLWRIGR